jgi:CheY-like chemotaxis protein
MGAVLSWSPKRKRNSRGERRVALTGRMLPEERERGLRAGFDEYLTKPVDFYHLRSVLTQIA